MADLICDCPCHDHDAVGSHGGYECFCHEEETNAQ